MVDRRIRPGKQAEAGDFELTAVADRVVWRSGELITGRLALTSTSAAVRALVSTGSPAVGRLTNLSGLPVGNDTRPHRGTGRSIDLVAGSIARIRFVCGSSLLEPDEGTTLPAGDYLLHLGLRLRIGLDHVQLTAAPLHIRLEQS